MATGAMVKVNETEVSLEERIRTRAYQLYLAREGEGGSAMEDWLMAEQEILDSKPTAS